MNRRGFLTALFALPFVKVAAPESVAGPVLARYKGKEVASVGLFYCPHIPLQFPNHARIPTETLTFKTRYDLGDPIV